MEPETKQATGDLHRRIFKKISLAAETFTHTVPVPVAIYFSIITGALPETRDQIMALISATFWGGLMVLWGVTWRYRALKKPLRALEDFEAGKKVPLMTRARAKKAILEHPRREGRMIIARWTVGVPGVHASIAPLLSNYSLDTALTIPFLLLLIIPISVVAYYFISENILADVLRLPRVREIRISSDKLPRIGYFQRILTAFVALTLLPLITMGYMLYAWSAGTLSISDHILLHLGLIAALFVIPLVVTAVMVARALRGGLANVGQVLTALGEGDLNVQATPTSVDEFGDQANQLARVIKKLKAMYTEIQDLNSNLEHKVEKRTAELKRTLDRVQVLKQQQDGDYFLTSLLIDPLGVNQGRGENVKIDFLVKQKKEFTFRKWSKEIGGDICIAQKIRLRGRTYIVFLNADAMGKSMQGAGGALIIGAVFQTIIDRTKLRSASHNKFPERWLKDAFLEMQKIFETFDGTMLVSVVFGLVEDHTGFMYYVNAEHPWSVVYRQGEAWFLEKENIVFRKLGTTGVEGTIHVSTFQMKEGDVLLFGSDGRDDIELGETEEGTRIINEDETEFLRRVEEADGKLTGILEAIQSRGKLTDDFSLLRLSFREGATKQLDPRTEEEIAGELTRARKAFRLQNYREAADCLERVNLRDPGNVDALYLTIRIEIEQGNYAPAVRAIEEYLYWRPGDDEILLAGAWCYKKLKNYKPAADLGEALRIRNPDNFRNLRNLAEVYIRLKKWERAELIAAEAADLLPGDEKLGKLRALIAREKRKPPGVAPLRLK